MLPQWLNEAQARIRAIRPDRQTIPFYAESWVSQFPHDPEVADLLSRHNAGITRLDVFGLSRSAAVTGAPDDLRRMFLGVMLWGFGTVGYGAHRTRLMLSSPGCLDTLARAFDLLGRDDVAAAYRTIRSAGISMCGTSFATKLLYFAGKGCGMTRYPLILDNRVHEALSKQLEPGAYSSLSRDSAASYCRYVTQMHEWAAAIGCEAHNIEFYLFSS